MLLPFHGKLLFQSNQNKSFLFFLFVLSFVSFSFFFSPPCCCCVSFAVVKTGNDGIKKKPISPAICRRHRKDNSAEARGVAAPRWSRHCKTWSRRFANLIYFQHNSCTSSSPFFKGAFKNYITNPFRCSLIFSAQLILFGPFSLQHRAGDLLHFDRFSQCDLTLVACFICFLLFRVRWGVGGGKRKACTLGETDLTAGWVDQWIGR